MDSPAGLGWRAVRHQLPISYEQSAIAESDMSQDSLAATRSKLDDLEQRIHAAKSSLGARGAINDEAQQDWNAMLEKHADIRRKLDARDDHPTGVIEGINFDVDILRTSLEKWVAKVEGNFAK
jgi:hypothetical protein